MVLRLTEYVILFLKRSRVGFSPFGVIIDRLVRSEVIVKSSFEPSRLVHSFQPSRVVRDVTISSAPVVRVVNWLRVNCGQIRGW